jgi:predicted AAA+ superfamily ATPase
VVKDIVNRKKITDAMMLKSAPRFVFDNIGNPLSSKKIADAMTSDGRKMDAKTVEKYLEVLSESYIIYQAKRYNIKGKQCLKTLRKYYVVDIGAALHAFRFQADGCGPYSGKCGIFGMNPPHQCQGLAPWTDRSLIFYCKLRFVINI